MFGRTLIVGAGSMGGAILRAALQEGLLSVEQCVVVVRTETHAAELHRELGITVVTDCPDGAGFDTIVLAVKPQVMPSVLGALTAVESDALILSVAAGITLEKLESALSQGRIVRAMPNTPILVKAGLTAIAVGRGVDQELEDKVDKLFATVGETVHCTEAELDKLGALAGSGPGYVFVIADALADAGVRIGLSRSLAIKAAVQTIYGSGLLAKETGSHPAVLRDQVCSPGGTTIAAIAAMEKGGLRSALQDGVVAAIERTKELGK